MKITAIRIIGLFGLYNYYIPFNSEAYVNLITSPNGYGKTTILTIINNLTKGYLFYFYNLPFAEIIIELTEDNQIIITKTEASTESSESSDFRQNKETNINFSWKSSTSYISFDINDKRIKSALRALRRSLNLTSDDINNLHSAELRDKILYSEEFYNTLSNPLTDYQEFQLKSHSLTTTFIPANRIYGGQLVDPDDDAEITWYKETLSPIKVVSRELRQELKKIRMNYLVQAQKLDSEFLTTLLSSTTVFTEEEYKHKVSYLNSKVEALLKYNLINRLKFLEYSDNDNDARILSTHINEVERKLSIYDDFLKKIELFSTLIENKVFANKKFTLSPAYGIRCISDNGAIIDLDCLSSGEQNQLILLYDFIFRVQDNSILLLDEPENSLHVSWQRLFINDIQLIAEKKNLQTIIATHSSRIAASVKNTWDLMYLNKGYGK